MAGSPGTMRTDDEHHGQHGDQRRNGQQPLGTMYLTMSVGFSDHGPIRIARWRRAARLQGCGPVLRYYLKWVVSSMIGPRVSAAFRSWP